MVKSIESGNFLHGLKVWYINIYFLDILLGFSRYFTVIDLLFKSIVVREHTQDFNILMNGNLFYGPAYGLFLIDLKTV